MALLQLLLTLLSRTAGRVFSLSWELPLPEHFEAAAKPVTEDQVAEVITCGPDPKRHVSAVQKYVEAGHDHVCVHQVGPDQQGFMKFYERDVLPKVVSARRRVKAGR